MASNIFNSIRLKKPQSNTFDLTHDVKFSARMGELTPVLATEVVPGDHFRIGAQTMIRFAPLIAPVMHRFDVTIHYFFVPNRLLWEKFPDFITNKPAVHPYLEFIDDVQQDEYRLMDYMGVPNPNGIQDRAVRVNPLPFAAYQMIYNEYYRDQNLIEEVPFALTDGKVSSQTRSHLLKMRRRAWKHDYFTSALPFAQKGGEVEIPLGEVKLTDDYPLGNQPKFVDATGASAADGDAEFYDDGKIRSKSDPRDLWLDPDGSLEVGSTTINNLRRAFKLQEWLEKNARGGTRYIEQILSHFGVRSSDKRLQRPEYITGVKTPITISEVLNTTGQVLPDGQDGTPLPQGNMSGHAVSVGSGGSGSYFAEEHGFIIGIMSVMPQPAYMDGLHRQFSKFSPFDYYWPSFAHIGEQEVKNQEIFISGGDPEGTFGYVPRYAEYKYIPSRVAGDFRGNLSYWHLARKFDNLPTLSQEFIECNPNDLTRIFAVETGQDELYCHVLNQIKARRPMPVFGTPMI